VHAEVDESQRGAIARGIGAASISMRVAARPDREHRGYDAALAELAASGANGVGQSAAEGARDAIGDLGAGVLAIPDDEMLLAADALGAADGAAVGAGAAHGAVAEVPNAEAEDDELER
jgi:hypothetical protein